MGMFQPNSEATVTLTPSQVSAVSTDGIAAPPFMVRDEPAISQSLGAFSLPDGYVQIPIFNHIETTMADDVDLGGCQYVATVDAYRFPAESTYSSVEWLKGDLREPFRQAFDLSEKQADDMSYMDLYNYCDIVESNVFEGLGMGYDYTTEQKNEIVQTVLSTLVLPLQEPILSRNMYVSKMLRGPLSFMSQVTANHIDGSAAKPETKFLSYSTHDWTVA